MTSVTTLNTQVSHIFVSDKKLDTDLELINFIIDLFFLNYEFQNSLVFVGEDVSYLDISQGIFCI